MFLFFIATFNWSYIVVHPTTTWMDTAVFAIFLVCALFCFVCSATYHMATCHSKNVRYFVSPILDPLQLIQFTGIGFMSLFRLCRHRHPYRWIFLPLYILCFLLPAKLASCVPYGNNYSRPWSVCYILLWIPKILTFTYRVCICCLKS